ncbi:phage recombination protein Bet [Lamprocystis purpurea]|jgi:phage recombination protein Bet|uniref:phage recombination protein Bet n=1 Tax=Lamprocystis purpurea TaxID=61598 RepID=UPI000367E2A4|nr:phage recombination protein Bet [Lamprocystis purpurea]
MAKRNNTNLVPVNGTQIADRLAVPAAALAELGLDAGTWKVLTESIFPSAKTAEGVLLAVRYCQARGLDVMKRPVHVVPMWSKSLNREVETVWPGIAEVQITAARTGLWVGMDPPKFGPERTRAFQGKSWNEDAHGYDSYEVTVIYPEWVEFTVYRLVSATRCPFTEIVFWEETYARIKKTEMPNEMWQKRPRSQLIKCGKAAALRAAFPEEAGEYTAEEMEGKAIEVESTPLHVQARVSEADAVMVPASKLDGESKAAPATTRLPVNEAAKDQAPAPDGDPTVAPAAESPHDAEREQLLDDHIKAHVAALIARALASGAWGSAEEYARTRFSGDHLAYALRELGKAAAAAVAKARAVEAKAA